MHAVARIAAARRDRGRGQPRSLDGLRCRDLPRLRGPDPGRGRAALQESLRLHRGAGVRHGARRLAGRGRVARKAGAPGPPGSAAVKLAVELARPEAQEPAAGGVGHVRLRRRVRGPRRPVAARRRRLEGALPRAPRRRAGAADRGDALRPAERDRPAGDRDPRLRARRAAAHAPARRRARRQRVRRHGRGVRRGGARLRRSPGHRGPRDQHLVPEREAGRDGLRRRSAHDARGRGRRARP